MTLSGVYYYCVRVGKGIYFASECGKSAGYVGCTKTSEGFIGVMFLNEVVYFHLYTHTRLIFSSFLVFSSILCCVHGGS